MKTKKIASILALTLTLVLIITGVGFGQAVTFTDNVIIPLEDFAVFVPCAAGGAGEVVVLNGNLHLLFHITEDASGGFHLQSHAQPQGVSGFGETTGDKYQGTGVTRSQFNTSGLPFETTSVNNFRIIGQGPGNNFSIHETFHITINAQGEVTAEVEKTSVTCK